jgi:MYXO-CTERM domain-containing protein
MSNRILYRTTACRGGTCVYPACEAGQVLVPFPGAGGSNYAEMFRWMNGTEGTPPFAGGVNPDPELRADLGTPLASSLDSIREWLTTANSSVGPGSGPLAPGHALTDTRASCRQYNVILLTDGQESCDGDPPAAATALRHVCTNGGTWDMADMRCEIAGVPTNTSNVKVYVIGFGVGTGLQADLNAIAAAGGTGQAYFPANRAELTASLADIVARSLPVPRCDCDGTCDDEAAAFPDKGMTCSVGVGRCKRTGVFACNAATDGTVCSSTSAATCPATPLVPGTPVMEVCGVAPGACGAPTAEDCADDDCDGQIDEGLSCLCRPEICNGLDDDCNGVVDDIPTTPCGLMVGICTAGTARCVPNGMGGASTVCQGGTGPQTEDCNGLDDNCNGIVDDVPARACFPTGFMGCTFNMMTRTFDCKGQCSPGNQICTMGSWANSSCVGAITPIPEVPCDMRDNNCDGLTDENNPVTGDQCYPTGITGCTANGASFTCVGECKPGQRVCDGATGAINCVNAVTPTAEVCDGKDNNCNGTIDEGFDVGTACDNGVTGACRKTGIKVCNSVGTGTVCNAGATTVGEEVCDGDDNDCDGLIDEAPLPGVGVPCGTPVGECRQGTTMCQNGRLTCSSVGPTEEVCDGLDNNCNGSVDENLPMTGMECRPPGLPPGPILGECKPGRSICTGAGGWVCQGGVGPSPEVCDGKDNNCDGIIDTGSMCPPGASCVNGECAPPCGQSETGRCQPDRVCVNEVCIRKECAEKPCAAGEVCNAEGKCVDPCAGVTCPMGTTCERGLCADCHTRRNCAAGTLCRVHECEPDPCYNVSCAVGSYCRAGTCVKACPATCGTGQRCQDGACVGDPCTTVTCGVNDYCDPNDGMCKPSGCSAGIQCMLGMVCVRSTGRCELNPCGVTRCQPGDSCRVQADGSAQCERDPTAPGTVTTLSAGGGGLSSCTCRLGDPGGSRSGGSWPLLMLALVGARFIRRRRRQGGGK